MSSGSTGQILGAVIGAAAAYFTGGLSIGAGAALGGAVGGLIDPAKTNTQGPRLEDLSVQYSSYGTGIPKLWGNGKVSGNVVWSTPKLEIATTTSAGKGGGATATSYDYYVYMSQVLCETPKDGSIVSIQQIWIDGALKWDATSGIPIGQALASATNLYASFELFQGHADQLPDPIEEGFSGGPGSVSAYRGVVRVRLNAIEAPQGRIPQFQFVLTTSPAQPQTTMLPVLTGSKLYATQDGSFWAFVPFSAGGVTYIDVYWSDGTAAWQTMRRIDLTPIYVYWSSPEFVVGARTPLALYGKGHIDALGATSSVVDVIDVTTGDVVEILSTAFSNLGPGYSGSTKACYDRKKNLYACSHDNGLSFQVDIILDHANYLEVDNTDILFQGSPIAMDDGILYVLSLALGQYQIAAKDASTGAHINTFVVGAPTLNTDLRGCAFQSDDTNIYLYLNETPTATTCSFYTLVIQKDISGALIGLGLNLISAHVPFETGAPDTSAGRSTSVYYKGSGIVLGPNATSGDQPEWQYTSFVGFQPESIPVAPILAELCEDVGVAYDVSELSSETDTVFGYVVTNPASARANMQPLMDALGIYTVDEDDVIKFRKLDNLTSQGLITFDELGQATQGDPPSDPFPLVRKQATDLARSLTLSYIAPSFDFQTSAQTVVRQVTDAFTDQTVELAVAITDDQAMTAAQRMMYAQWSAQNTRSCTVSRKFAYLSPGDGVSVEYPRGQVGVYRVTQATDTGLMIQLALEPADPALFAQTAVGATGYIRSQVAPLPAPLRAQVLDIPILRDQDNNAGPYVALDSFDSSPANGQLLVGDSVASLLPVGTVTASAPIGFAETALGSFSRQLVDERNVFTINIGGSTFNSVTRDVLLANGGEFWALGAPGRWEIGCSAAADSLGNGRYILSRHLRGLFGTEANADNHQSGDTFVLLRPVGMLRPDTGVGGIGQSKVYQAVPRTANPANAPTQTYTNTGEGLVPLAPLNLRRTDTNDFTIDRRSRVTMNNATGTLPIGEVNEQYSWSFYDSTFSNLLGTVVTNVPMVTAAQQTAIGRTPSATAYIRVGQVSDSVGVGHLLQGTK